MLVLLLRYSDNSESSTVSLIFWQYLPDIFAQILRAANVFFLFGFINSSLVIYHSFEDDMATNDKTLFAHQTIDPFQGFEEAVEAQNLIEDFYTFLKDAPVGPLKCH